MTLPVITNIQRYSIHDGDGTRTTVFFKGCPLSCAWCHNPEGQAFTPEFLFHTERCTGCGRCVTACDNAAIQSEQGVPQTCREHCRACGGCVERCPSNAREIAGKPYPLTALFRELEKDERFYEQSGGGVTLSGGEVLAQDMDYVTELLRRVKRAGWGTAIDTCGAVPWERFERVLPLTDLFLYDLKCMDSDTHRRYTGMDNALILDNLRRLTAAGATVDIRIPVISGVNAATDTMEAVITFLRECGRVRRICLLPYHNTGSGKYAKLGKHYTGEKFGRPSDAAMEEFRARFQAAGFRAQIGG